MENEIWKDIKGYEKMYQVSNLGRVKSLARVIIRGNGKPHAVRERILRAQDDGSGRLRCKLYGKQGKATKKVHRIVCEAFNARYRDSLSVDHLDSDVKNNRADNLDPCTLEENVSRSHRTGAHRKLKGAVYMHRRILSPEQDSLIWEAYNSDHNKNAARYKKPFTQRWLARAFKTNQTVIKFSLRREGIRRNVGRGTCHIQ